jgi:hypothetical protein
MNNLIYKLENFMYGSGQLPNDNGSPPRQHIPYNEANAPNAPSRPTRRNRDNDQEIQPANQRIRPIRDNDQEIQPANQRIRPNDLPQLELPNNDNIFEFNGNPISPIADDDNEMNNSSFISNDDQPININLNTRLRQEEYPEIINTLINNQHSIWIENLMDIGRINKLTLEITKFSYINFLYDNNYLNNEVVSILNNKNENFFIAYLTEYLDSLLNDINYDINIIDNLNDRLRSLIYFIIDSKYQNNIIELIIDNITNESEYKIQNYTLQIIPNRPNDTQEEMINNRKKLNSIQNYVWINKIFISYNLVSNNTIYVFNYITFFKKNKLIKNKFIDFDMNMLKKMFIKFLNISFETNMNVLSEDLYQNILSDLFIKLFIPNLPTNLEYFIEYFIHNLYLSTIDEIGYHYNNYMIVPNNTIENTDLNICPLYEPEIDDYIHFTYGNDNYIGKINDENIIINIKHKNEYIYNISPLHINYVTKISKLSEYNYYRFSHISYIQNILFNLDADFLKIMYPSNETPHKLIKININDNKFNIQELLMYNILYEGQFPYNNKLEFKIGDGIDWGGLFNTFNSLLTTSITNDGYDSKYPFQYNNNFITFNSSFKEDKTFNELKHDAVQLYYTNQNLPNNILEITSTSFLNNFMKQKKEYSNMKSRVYNINDLSSTYYNLLGKLIARFITYNSQDNKFLTYLSVPNFNLDPYYLCMIKYNQIIKSRSIQNDGFISKFENIINSLDYFKKFLPNNKSEIFNNLKHDEQLMANTLNYQYLDSIINNREILEQYKKNNFTLTSPSYNFLKILDYDETEWYTYVNQSFIKYRLLNILDTLFDIEFPLESDDVILYEVKDDIVFILLKYYFEYDVFEYVASFMDGFFDCYVNQSIPYKQFISQNDIHKLIDFSPNLINNYFSSIPLSGINFIISGPNTIDIDMLIEIINNTNVTSDNLEIIKNKIISTCKSQDTDTVEDKINKDKLIKSILIFITGSSMMPNKLEFNFEHIATPYNSHTCFNTLDINIDLLENTGTGTHNYNGHGFTLDNSLFNQQWMDINMNLFTLAGGSNVSLLNKLKNFVY